MTETEEKELLAACVAEAMRARECQYELPLLLDLPSLADIVAFVQLASTHPGVPPTQAARVRKDQIIGRVEEDGYPATARMLEAGFHRENDV